MKENLRNKTFTFRATESEAALISEYCKEQRISQSELIREAIKNFIKKAED